MSIARRSRPPRALRPRLCALGAVFTCGLAWLALGCSSESPTSPPVSLSPARPVGVAVTDSLGAGVSSAALVATSLFDVNGLAIVIYDDTDADGEALLRLRPGAWILSTRGMDGRVAGGHALIMDPANDADSVLVRLVVHAPSRIEGRALLAGRADHHGIIVSAIGIGGACAVTDTSGAYALDGVPPGTWTVFYGSPGFGDQFENVTVPVPGSTVTAPDVTLLSSP